MIYKSFLIIVFCAFSSMASAGNYIITIDGEDYEVSLGETRDIEVKGNKLSFELKQKEVLTHLEEGFTFDHPRQFIPAKTDLGDGVTQTVVMTPLGSTIILQDYQSLNPAGLLDLMINELVKQELEYGYEINEESDNVELSDGKAVAGKRVYSIYNGETIERFVGTYGHRDAGMLLIIQEFQGDADSKVLIDTVLESLKIIGYQ